MTRATKKQPVASPVEDLRREILRLAKDRSLPEMKPLTGEEDEEELERRQAESMFRHSFCKRIFWRLSAEHRRAVRSMVLKGDSSYATSCGTALDMECLREIERALGGDEG